MEKVQAADVVDANKHAATQANVDRLEAELAAARNMVKSGKLNTTIMYGSIRHFGQVMYKRQLRIGVTWRVCGPVLNVIVRRGVSERSPMQAVVKDDYAVADQERIAELEETNRKKGQRMAKAESQVRKEMVRFLHIELRVKCMVLQWLRTHCNSTRLQQQRVSVLRVFLVVERNFASWNTYSLAYSPQHEPLSLRLCTCYVVF